MKRKLFFIAVIVICLSLTAYGTLAYFTAEDTAHNIITSGNVDIELREWADEDKTEPFPEEGISGVMPNTSVTKIVEVENTGSGSAWVRVKVDNYVVFALGDEIESDSDKLIIDFNTKDWTRKGEYYYYNTPLAAGATTVPLFTSVYFDAAMGNEYQNATARVVVSAQAVQSANNGDTPLAATGWPKTT